MTGVKISSHFPGGNIVVDSIKGNRVSLHQDLRDTRGDWFYWAFEVEGMKPGPAYFRFSRGDVIGQRGPAVSTDRGATWRWLGTDHVAGESFRYDFINEKPVRFSMNIPHFPDNFDAFLEGAGSAFPWKRHSLCSTPRGRNNEYFLLGNLGNDAPYHLILTARHHACESMAGYVMEGILSILSDGGDRGRWFRDNVQILAVPFMDRDGVLDGDQGKNRRPHDHNRDYGSDPVHPSVSALKKSVTSLPGKSRKIALDLHCPYIKGGETNHQVYFVGGPGKKNEERVKEFLKVAVPLQTGPVPFTGMNYLPFGTLWNTNDSPEHISCARWMQTVPGMDFASTLEFPYAEAQGIEVIPERARWFGRDLGRGLHRYLSRDR